MGPAPRVGLLAVAALAAGSLAAVSWLTRDARAPDAPAAVAATDLAADLAAGFAAPPLGTASEPPERSGGASEPAPPSPPSPAAAPSPRPGLERVAVMPPARRRALWSFRREVSAGLAALRERVTACAPPAEASSAGALAPRRSLVLEVETVEGGIRILDVTPEGEGDDFAACARAALRDGVIPAPSAEPGRRWTLPFSP